MQENRKHLVVIGLIVPESQSTAAGFRMLQLLELFKKWNYQITFLTSAQQTDFSDVIDFQRIAINDSSFDDVMRQLNPDVVLFDRYITEEQFGWRVAETCPHAVRILDTEDLHFLREARKLAFKQHKKCNDAYLYNPIFYREIASILRCDFSLIISEYEHQLLTDKFNIQAGQLFYIPFLWEKCDFTPPGFEERQHFFSIGNFIHEPNWQTVLQLKNIWKDIRKQLPNTELHIYGAYAGDKVQQLHNEKEGFIIKGRAKSSEDVFKKYRVLLAPIPFGAGLKGKLFESMKYGCPNVTSTIGAEGMNTNKFWNGFIYEDSKDFAKNAVDLYSSEEIWTQAQRKGYEILDLKFRRESFENPLKTKILEIESSLEQHRNHHFLGRLLQQNQLNATKFMSRWIEEKNKKL